MVLDKGWCLDRITDAGCYGLTQHQDTWETATVCAATGQGKVEHRRLPDRESIFLPNADVMLWSQQLLLALILLEMSTKKKLRSNLLQLFWKYRKEKLMKDLRWNQAQKYLFCYLKYIIIHTQKNWVWQMMYCSCSCLVPLFIFIY